MNPLLALIVGFVIIGGVIFAKRDTSSDLVLDIVLYAIGATLVILGAA